MRRIFYVLGMCLLFSGGAHFVVAQTAVIDDCQSSPEAKAKCEADLERLEKEKVEVTKDLNVTKTQSSSFQKDVNVLTSEIKQKQLNIKAKDINIKQIGGEIVNKTKKIGELNGQIQRGQESLAQIIKKLNQVDEVTLPEIVFSNASLSDALLDIDNFNSINRSVEDLFASIRGTKTVAEKEKEALDKKKADELGAKKVIEENKKIVEKKEAEKKQLLTLSKNKEVAYTQVLAEKEKRAQQIRAALFELRDTNGIPFGTALEYANFASQKTGVRPALILAILTQETNLGKVEGKCYLKNKDGSGVNIRNIPYTNVMNPANIPNFIIITSEIGKDPYNTLVSCPYWNKASQKEEGWGGAMGPAQFTGSTWMAVRKTVASFLGNKTANPWNPKDAFMAAAVLLRDNGASAKGYTAEYNAAWRYFSGGLATASKISRFGDYGASVYSIASKLQTNSIDVLEGN
jgi:peptidoglycan hydrolase CwlO-like protein